MAGLGGSLRPNDCEDPILRARIHLATRVVYLPTGTACIWLHCRPGREMEVEQVLHIYAMLMGSVLSGGWYKSRIWGNCLDEQPGW